MYIQQSFSAIEGAIARSLEVSSNGSTCFFFTGRIAISKATKLPGFSAHWKDAAERTTAAGDLGSLSIDQHSDSWHEAWRLGHIELYREHFDLLDTEVESPKEG